MPLKRLDTLDVATTDAGGAASVFQRNFGFKLVRRAPDIAVLKIGDSEIALKSGASVESALAANGEGMAGLWLEADDVEVVAYTLDKAGFKYKPVGVENGRRIIAVDPESSSHVPLFLFDRKA